jgi:hypothetical protein
MNGRKRGIVTTIADSSGALLDCRYPVTRSGRSGEELVEGHAQGGEA